MVQAALQGWPCGAATLEWVQGAGKRVRRTSTRDVQCTEEGEGGRGQQKRRGEAAGEAIWRQFYAAPRRRGARLKQENGSQARSFGLLWRDWRCSGAARNSLKTEAGEAVLPSRMRGQAEERPCGRAGPRSHLATEAARARTVAPTPFHATPYTAAPSPAPPCFS